MKSTQETAGTGSVRKYQKQRDVPATGLTEAIKIAQTLNDQFTLKPTRPLNVASALNQQPSTSGFRMLCGSSIAYGLTKGGYNAKAIEITPLGIRVLRPKEEGDDLLAKREAVLKPRILGEFLAKYDGSAIPRGDIAANVLEDMGVPMGRGGDALQLILANAEDVGFIKNIGGKKYVDLSGGGPVSVGIEHEGTDQGTENTEIAATRQDSAEPSEPGARTNLFDNAETRVKKVFVSHGTNKSFLPLVKKLVKYGELEPIVSVERQSVSAPVPEKVLTDMRSCGAAIIHVDAETVLLDKDANEHVILNENVLIEIGAAMALYGKRFILLVRDGVRLPSNLQGLYEVRYTGDELGGEATVKLLEAISDIKNHSLPDVADTKA